MQCTTTKTEVGRNPGTQTALFKYTYTHMLIASKQLKQNYMRTHTLSFASHMYTLKDIQARSSCVLTKTRHTCSSFSSSSHFNFHISLELNSHLGESDKVSLLPFSLYFLGHDWSTSALSYLLHRPLCVLAYVRMCNQLVSLLCLK